MKSTQRPAWGGLWLFFILTFALSWTSWIIAIAGGMTSTTFPGMLLFVLGGSGPSIIAVILLFLRVSPSKRGEINRGDFWRRTLNFRQIRPGWWALILLGSPLIVAISIGLNALGNGSAPAYDGLRQIAAAPAALLGFLLIGIIAGPLSEELGWRGYALDPMIARWGQLPASLILGLIWWAWHLPLFFLKGTSHYSWGLGTMEFWSFLLTGISLSVLITWAYVQNNRSILAAIVIHFMFNFVLSLVFPIGPRILMFAALLHAVLAFGVVAFARRAAPQPAPRLKAHHRHR